MKPNQFRAKGSAKKKKVEIASKKKERVEISSKKREARGEKILKDYIREKMNNNHDAKQIFLTNEFEKLSADSNRFFNALTKESMFSGPRPLDNVTRFVRAFIELKLFRAKPAYQVLNNHVLKRLEKFIVDEKFSNAQADNLINSERPKRNGEDNAKYKTDPSSKLKFFYHYANEENLGKKQTECQRLFNIKLTLEEFEGLNAILEKFSGTFKNEVGSDAIQKTVVADSDYIKYFEFDNARFYYKDQGEDDLVEKRKTKNVEEAMKEIVKEPLW